MDVILIVAAFLVWFFIGAYSFYWFWTSKYDLESENLMTMILCGICGVFGLIAVFISFYEASNKILFKKRK